MSKQQNLRLLAKAAIVIGLIGCLWLLSVIADSHDSRRGNSQARDRSRISIPVVAKQLDSVHGVPPVELRCDATALVLPDTLEAVPCRIKNNAGRAITAIVLGNSVTISKNGKISAASGYTTIDTFVHPDFHKSAGLNQYSEPQFPFATESYDGIITQLRVYVDYVEFADRRTLGPNRRGAELVAGIREGAAKYKAWLVTQFQKQGTSADTLIRLLEEDQLHTDLELKNGSEEQGAAIYRNQLRKIHRTEGLKELMREWKYRNGSAH